MAEDQEESLALRLFRAFPVMHEPNDWVYREQPGGDVCSMLQEIAEIVEKKLKPYGTKLSPADEDFILLHLCRAHQGVRERSSKREWDIATLLCIHAFVKWCIAQFQGREGLSRRQVYNFLKDLTGLKICPDLMLREGMNRLGSPLEMFHFHTIVRHLYWEEPLSDLSSELFCIFGLRQALETAFFRMVGFFDTIPRVKFSAMQMLDILVSREKKMTFSPEKTIPLKRLGDVCQWADKTVHSMFTAPTWSIWMAFAASGFLFNNRHHKVETSHQTLYPVTIPEKDFHEMREELIRKLLKNAIAQKNAGEKAFANVNDLKIRWIPPSANITDGKEHFLLIDGETTSHSLCKIETRDMNGDSQQ